MVHTILARRLSQENMNPYSGKRPGLRKRSISDSNLLQSQLFSETKLFDDQRLRSYTATTNLQNKSNLRKRSISISEKDLHRVNIVFNKPPAPTTETVKNRKAHCFGVRELEEGDGAETLDEEVQEGLRGSDNEISRQTSDENGANTRNTRDKNNKENTKKKVMLQQHSQEAPQQQQQQRKRKNGFSSFSLTKFMTGKIRMRSQTYEPDDPRQLIMAIRNRDINRVRYILEQCPVDVNGPNSKGVTAVHEAALDGQCNIIQLLLQYRADVNRTDVDGLTCLDYAVYGGHFECATLLIGEGATVKNVRDGIPSFF